MTDSFRAGKPSVREAEVSVTDGALGLELAALFASTSPLLTGRIARRFGLAREDAEDCVQKAFIAYWLKKPSCNQPVAWLGRVAARFAVNVLRNRERRARAHRLAIASASDAVEETVGTRVMLRSALGRLEPRVRRLVLLRYIVGYSEAKAARLTGYAPSSARKTLHRARMRLRSFLSTEEKRNHKGTPQDPSGTIPGNEPRIQTA